MKKATNSGCAFLECPAAKERYGRDVYMHAAIIVNCGVRMGDVVAFGVHLNAEGMPQASLPLWKRVPDDLTRPVGAILQNAAGGPGTGWKWAGPGGQNPLMLNLNPMMGKGRAFVPAAKMGMMKGKGGTGKGYGGGAGRFGGGSPPGGGCAMMTCPPGALRRGREEKAGTGERVWQPSGLMFVGTVRISDGEKAFINCDALKMQYGRDTYVHKRVAEAASLKVGDVVGFELHVSRAGMPQASSPIFKVVAGRSHPEIFGRAA